MCFSFSFFFGKVMLFHYQYTPLRSYAFLDYPFGWSSRIWMGLDRILESWSICLFLVTWIKGNCEKCVNGKEASETSVDLNFRTAELSIWSILDISTSGRWRCITILLKWSVPCTFWKVFVSLRNKHTWGWRHLL